MGLNLNFGGALAGLGHGLATLGQQGMEEQQRVAADARLTARETALANLHHGWEEQATADAPRDYAAMTPVTVARDAAIARDVTIPVHQATVAAETALQDHHAAVEHGYRSAEQGTEHGYRMQESDAAETRRVVHNYVDASGHPVIVYGDGRERTLAGTARAPEGQDPGAVVHRYVNTQNHPVLVLRNGTEQVLPGTVRQNRPADDLGLNPDDGNAGGGSTPPASVAPPAIGRSGRPVLTAPTPSAGAPPAGFPDARRAADGNWYVTRNGQTHIVLQ